MNAKTFKPAWRKTRAGDYIWGPFFIGVRSDGCYLCIEQHVSGTEYATVPRAKREAERIARAILRQAAKETN